jgi:hypothetical protein
MQVWNGNEWVIARPWMRHSPEHWTKHISEEQWEEILKNSITPEQYALILQSRERNRKDK